MTTTTTAIPTAAAPIDAATKANHHSRSRSTTLATVLMAVAGVAGLVALLALTVCGGGGVGSSSTARSNSLSDANEPRFVLRAHPPVLAGPCPQEAPLILFGQEFYPHNTTSIHLRDQGLTGTIPSQLGLLTSLTDLSLSRNALTGSIPTELASLTKLERLVLFHNNLQSNIPSELGLLTQLTGLRLDSNQLSGSIPTELSALTRLTGLILRHNALTGTIPEALGGDASKSKLEQLYLYGNNLTGTVPTGICEWTQTSSETSTQRECFIDVDSVLLPSRHEGVCGCSACVGPYC